MLQLIIMLKFPNFVLFEQAEFKSTENARISENEHYCELRLNTLSRILKPDCKKNHSEYQKPSGNIRVQNLSLLIRILTANISVPSNIFNLNFRLVFLLIKRHSILSNPEYF